MHGEHDAGAVGHQRVGLGAGHGTVGDDDGAGAVDLSQPRPREVDDPAPPRLELVDREPDGEVAVVAVGHPDAHVVTPERA